MQKPEIRISDYPDYVGVHESYPKIKFLKALRLPGLEANGIAIFPEKLKSELTLFWEKGYEAAQKDIRKSLGI